LRDIRDVCFAFDLNKPLQRGNLTWPERIIGNNEPASYAFTILCKHSETKKPRLITNNFLLSTARWDLYGSIFSNCGIGIKENVTANGHD
jgi:hypothetical protein